MKKTISVNIKGMNFMIEEDAFELLQDYLDRLEGGLRHEKGQKEIIEDIELRIAELFTVKLNEKKQVVEIEDVQEVLEMLGDPSLYIEDSNTAGEQKFYNDNAKSAKQHSERRLFRDVENGRIAGVCQGISNFLNVDVIIVRLVFVLMGFFAGFGIPLYIILWVVVPQAANTIDKLRMRGRPITVESVREEVENAAERIKNESNAFANRMRRKKDAMGSLANEERMSSLSRLLRTVIAMGFILTGLFLFVCFMVFGFGELQFIPIENEFGFMSLSQVGELVLANNDDYEWAWIGGILISFSVIFFLWLTGVNILFKIRSRWMKASFGALILIGTIGVGICFFIAARTGRDLAAEGELEREIGVVNVNELVIEPQFARLSKYSNYEVKSNGNFNMLIKGNTVQASDIEFIFKSSKDSLFHISQNLSAHSSSHYIAFKKAKNIRHKLYLDSSRLFVNAYYSFPKADKLRNQEVKIIIAIPTGKQVKINDQIIHLMPEVNEDVLDDEPRVIYRWLHSNGEFN